MTKAVHPARRARAVTGVVSAAALLAMVAGFEFSARADAPATAGLPRARSEVVPRIPAVSPPAAATPAAPVDPAPAAAPAPDPAPVVAPAPVVVVPPPAPAPPPAGTSGGSGH